MPHRLNRDSIVRGGQESIYGPKETFHFRLLEARKSRVDLASGAGIEGLDVETDARCHRLQVSDSGS